MMTNSIYVDIRKLLDYFGAESPRQLDAMLTDKYWIFTHGGLNKFGVEYGGKDFEYSVREESGVAVILDIKPSCPYRTVKLPKFVGEALIGRMSLNEQIMMVVEDVINEEFNSYYSVEWEFYKTKSYSPDDMQANRNGTSRPTDFGYVEFDNEEDAYQLFLEKMQNHEGEYAALFKIKRNGDVIEDLSKTRIFNGRVKGHDEFMWQWNKYQNKDLGKPMAMYYFEDPYKVNYMN